MKKLEQENQEAKFLQYDIPTKKRVMINASLELGRHCLIAQNKITMSGLGNAAYWLFNGVPGITCEELSVDQGEYRDKLKSPSGIVKGKSILRGINRQVLIDILQGMTSEDVIFNIFNIDEEICHPVSIIGNVGDKKGAALIATMNIDEDYINTLKNYPDPFIVNNPFKEEYNEQHKN